MSTVQGTDRAATVLPGPSQLARPAVWRAVLAALAVVVAGDVAAVLTVGRAAGAASASASRTEVAAPPGTGVLPPGEGSELPAILAIPSLGLQTGLQDIVVELDGELVPPVNASVAGWWSQGTVPGATGPAVIVGHVDSTTGPGVFIGIHKLKSGDAVNVTRDDGEVVTFVVDAVKTYDKTKLPTAEVYGPTAAPELRLITCGGRFNRRTGSYEFNVVVFAHRSDGKPA